MSYWTIWNFINQVSNSGMEGAKEVARKMRNEYNEYEKKCNAADDKIKKLKAARSKIETQVSCISDNFKNVKNEILTDRVSGEDLKWTGSNKNKYCGWQKEDYLDDLDYMKSQAKKLVESINDEISSLNASKGHYLSSASTKVKNLFYQFFA